MPTTLYENRPSAGIGVVEMQRLEVFCDFVWARAILCGDRRGRGAKTRGFLRFCLGPRDPWSRCKNSSFFLRFCLGPHDPLRGSAWSRCKTSRFFATLVVRTGPRAPGTGGSLVRFPPGPRAGFASCAEQLALSNLRRATCAEQVAQTIFAQSNLHRPVGAERLA